MDDEIVIMLIGNKSDLVDDEPINRAVTYQEASKFAKEKGLYYFETSAKTGHNVKESFQFMVEGNFFMKMGRVFVNLFL